MNAKVKQFLIKDTNTGEYVLRTTSAMYFCRAIMEDHNRYRDRLLYMVEVEGGDIFNISGCNINRHPRLCFNDPSINSCHPLTTTRIVGELDKHEVFIDLADDEKHPDDNWLSSEMSDVRRVIKSYITNSDNTFMYPSKMEPLDVGRGILPQQPTQDNPEDNNDLEDIILVDFLGYCSCGFPDDAVDALYRYLVVLTVLEEKFNPKQFFGVTEDDGVITLLHYALEVAGITEHGSSVPGWLTDKGWALFVYVLVYKIQSDETNPVLPDNISFRGTWKDDIYALCDVSGVPDGVTPLTKNQINLLKETYPELLTEKEIKE